MTHWQTVAQPAPSALLCTALLLLCSRFALARSLLSLHDALPISLAERGVEVDDRDLSGHRKLLEPGQGVAAVEDKVPAPAQLDRAALRSEEHTSELQSPMNLARRLLPETKKSSWCW